MTQLSRERLETIALNDYATHAESVEMARRLLAAEAQEPVAYMIGGHYLMHAQDPKVDNYASAVPLYAAPQPVAVPDDDKTNMLCDSAYVNGLQAGFSMGQMNQEAEYAQTVEHYRKGIREYRAAVLNAEPVSRPYTLPSELLAAMEEVLRISDRDHEAWHRARDGIAACRPAPQEPTK